MKQIAKGLQYKFVLTFLIIAFLQTGIWAQDNGTSANGSGSAATKPTSVTSWENEWFSSPWLWIAGAAVFILLLVALFNGSNGATTSHTGRFTVPKSSTSDDLV